MNTTYSGTVGILEFLGAVCFIWIEPEVVELPSWQKMPGAISSRSRIRNRGSGSSVRQSFVLGDRKLV